MADRTLDADKVAAAAKTYIYGYPFLYCLEEIGNIAAGTSGVGVQAPVNTFAAARQLLDPAAEFVSPNNDTLYVVAACDLSAGPLALDTPDTDDRYFVLQFVDAWTNNFAYVGRRATGTAAQQYLLVPEGYDGDDHGRGIIECPSTIFVIVGRVQLNGPDDLPAVHALQDGFTITALDRAGSPDGPPVGDPRAPEDLAWWERFRVALAAFPPPASDQEYLDSARELGLLDEPSVLVDANPDLAAVLVAGQAQGEELIETLSKTSMEIVDGWTTALHAFDYNTDHLGPGTIDSPEWKMKDRTKAHVARAVAARLGLWGNHGYEADYHILWQDEHGDTLDGSRTYELTLSPEPPVDAFWSLTMYDEPNYYLVENPIDRYSIGDRTSGLVIDDDGSVTILMQHGSPGSDRESNWLPAPPGGFRPILRSYQPRSPILEGRYRFPPVRRTS